MKQVVNSPLGRDRPQYYLMETVDAFQRNVTERERRRFFTLFYLEMKQN